MDKRKLISRNDLILIATIAIVALCIYMFILINRTDGENLYAEIRMNGITLQTVSLEEDKTFYLDEHPAIQFIIKDGRIAIYKSDCPDQICVRNGFLHLIGQSSVCLPNRLVLAIVGFAGDGDDIDVFLD